MVSIIIEEEFVQERKKTIIKDSEEEKEFINKLKVNISNMNTTNILDSNILEYLTQAFFSIAGNLWNKYSKIANITKCSKAWLNEKCNRNLATYHMSRRKINWISYKMVRIAKYIFFDNKIQEIASTNKRPFNLIN